MPLLQHLHDEFPTAAAEGEEWVSAEMEYTELLVDLKTKVRSSRGGEERRGEGRGGAGECCVTLRVWVCVCEPY